MGDGDGILPIGRRTLLAGGIGSLATLSLDQLFRTHGYGHPTYGETTGQTISVLGVEHEQQHTSLGGSFDASVAFVNASFQYVDLSLRLTTVATDGSVALTDESREIDITLAPYADFSETFTVDVPAEVPEGEYETRVSASWSNSSVVDLTPSQTATALRSTSDTAGISIGSGSSSNIGVGGVPKDSSKRYDLYAPRNIAAAEISLDGAIGFTGDALDAYIDATLHPVEDAHGILEGFHQSAMDTMETIGETIETTINLLENPYTFIPLVQELWRRFSTNPWETLFPSIQRIQSEFEAKIERDRPESYGPGQSDAFAYGWCYGYALFQVLWIVAVSKAADALAGAATQLISNSAYVSGTVESASIALLEQGVTGVAARHGGRQVARIVSRFQSTDFPTVDSDPAFTTMARLDVVDEQLDRGGIGVTVGSKGDIGEHVQTHALYRQYPDAEIVPPQDLTTDLDPGTYISSGIVLDRPRGDTIGELDNVVVRVPEKMDGPEDADLLTVTEDKIIDVQEWVDDPNRPESTADEVIERIDQDFQDTLQTAANDGVYTPEPPNGEFLLTTDHMQEAADSAAIRSIVGPLDQPFPERFPITKAEFDAIFEYHQEHGIYDLAEDSDE